jgi:hypothetical protein
LAFPSRRLDSAATEIHALSTFRPRPLANLSQKFGRLGLVPKSGLSAELLGAYAVEGATYGSLTQPRRPTVS